MSLDHHWIIPLTEILGYFSAFYLLLRHHGRQKVKVREWRIMYAPVVASATYIFNSYLYIL